MFYRLIIGLDPLDTSSCLRIETVKYTGTYCYTCQCLLNIVLYYDSLALFNSILVYRIFKFHTFAENILVV